MRLGTNSFIAFALACMALTTGYLPAEAQEEKPHRIGFLTARANPRSVGVVKEGLLALGYAEGRDFNIVHRYKRGTSRSLPDLAAELIGLDIDVIVTPYTEGALAVRDMGTTIPMVVVTSEFVKNGLVTSLSRPGGNVTGFSTRNPELAGKQLELFKEAFPEASRVSVLWAGKSGASRRTYRQLEAAALKLGLELQSIEIREDRNTDFGAVLKAAMKPSVDAFFVVSSRLLSNNRPRIIELINTTRLPAMYNHSRWVKAGGLMSYAPRRRDLYLLAAAYVDKILKGARPADLPVQRASRIYLDVNLKTAKALGMTIPSSILYRADKVIR